MGWSKLKWMLAGILAASNVILFLYTQALIRASEYIPEDTLRQMISVLSEQGIDVPESTIDSKKPELVIYEGKLGDTYYTDVAESLSGCSVSLSFNTPNGCILTMSDGDRYSFYDGFGIRYEKSDAPDYLHANELNMENLTELSASEVRSLERAVSSFLSASRKTHSEPQSVSLSFETIFCGEDPSSRIRYCVGMQRAKGTAVRSFRAVFAVLEGQVIGMSGKWCFSELETSYFAQLIDQVNIMYRVKDLVLEESSGKSGRLNTIHSLTLGYAAYFRADTDCFYLIPVWNAEMDDEKTYVINALDASLYTD